MQARQAVVGLIQVIYVGLTLAVIGLVLYFLIGFGLPWWIAVAPCVIVGLFGVGLVLKWTAKPNAEEPPYSEE